MRKSLYIGAGTALALCGIGATLWISRSDTAEQRRYERNQAQVVIANPTQLPVGLFRSGEGLASAQEIAGFGSSTVDHARGNYFLRAEHEGSTLLYPIPVLGYRAGPRPMVRFRSLSEFHRNDSLP